MRPTLSNLAPLLALVLLSGCASLSHRPSCVPLATASVHDTVVVEVVHREVVVFDTLFVEIPRQVEHRVVRCDSSFLSNDYALSRAAILKNGDLFHSLESRQQSLSQVSEKSVEVRDSIIYRERLVTQLVERDRPLSAWQRFRLSAFNYLVVLFVALLMLKRWI